MNRRMILTYNDYAPNDRAESVRHVQAMMTWNFHTWRGSVVKNRVMLDDLSRSSADLGDERPVAYVKDLIEAGMSVARPQDAVLIINRDVCLTSTAPMRIWKGLDGGIAACPRRNMSPIPTGRLFRSVMHCPPDGGYDLFAITPGWWASHGDKMPDMLIGRETWDTCLRLLANETTGRNADVDDTSYHSAHRSYWKQSLDTNPGQLHNRRLGRQFLKQRHGGLWLLRDCALTCLRQWT